MYHIIECHGKSKGNSNKSLRLYHLYSFTVVVNAKLSALHTHIRHLQHVQQSTTCGRVDSKGSPPPSPTASNEQRAIAGFLFFDWLWSACSRHQNYVFSVAVIQTLHDLVVPYAQRISSFGASCMVNLSERITEGAQQFGVQFIFCHTDSRNTSWFVFAHIVTSVHTNLQCFRLAHLAQDWEWEQYKQLGASLSLCGYCWIHRVLGNLFIVDRE